MKSITCHGPVAHLVLVMLSLGVLESAPPVAGADRIILRNLKTITTRSVTSFDEDGIRLDDGSLLVWDEVERITLSDPAAGSDRSQARLDQLLTELGGNLYRIRQRLVTGDYQGLLEHAEAMYPRYVGRESETAYLVKQALMWGRLAVGRRESALEPYLRCLIYLQSHERAPPLPGERRLRYERESGLTPELAPIWFDAQAAQENLPAVFRCIAEMPRPRPGGVYVYYATMALAAGDDAGAEKVLSTMQGKPPISDLRIIVEAQREVLKRQPGTAISALAAGSEKFLPATRPLARYWLGMGQLANSDEKVRQNGLLELLRIPVLHGQENPELAGAALYRTLEALSAAGNERGSLAVRRELLDRYGQTYFALQVKADSAKAGSVVPKRTEVSP